jgi:HTH-type transcriptional regulator/antitoxin HipB
MILKTPEDVGALIKEKRNALGLDQETLARQSGTSRKWIVEIEKGKSGAAMGLVLRTLRVLGISLQSLESSSKTSSHASAPPAINLDDVIDSLKRRS